MLITYTVCLAIAICVLLWLQQEHFDLVSTKNPAFEDKSRVIEQEEII